MDAGQLIPNLNSDFSGSAPDLGAYELSAPLPHYGPRPRGWSDEVKPVSCDFNGDGSSNIMDVISLLLFQQDNPGNLGGDFNGDGRANISDAIAMLRALRDSTCP